MDARSSFQHQARAGRHLPHPHSPLAVRRPINETACRAVGRCSCQGGCHGVFLTRGQTTRARYQASLWGNSVFGWSGNTASQLSVPGSERVAERFASVWPSGAPAVIILDGIRARSRGIPQSRCWKLGPSIQTWWYRSIERILKANICPIDPKSIV